MPVEAMENFIRENLDRGIIRSHSWTTAPLDNFENAHVMSVKIDNMVSFRSFP